MKTPPRPIRPARRFAIRYALAGSAISDHTRWSTPDQAEAEVIAAAFNERFAKRGDHKAIEHFVAGYVVVNGRRVYQEK